MVYHTDGLLYPDFLLRPSKHTSCLTELLWGAAAAAARPAPRLPVAGKKSLLAPRKVGSKSGGLGVKKLATKVDDSLFDQKPVEAPPPLPVGPSIGATTPEGEHLTCKECNVRMFDFGLGERHWQYKFDSHRGYDA